MTEPSTSTSTSAYASPHRSGHSRVLRNVFSNWTCYAISVAVNFFLSPFVVHHLGNTAYGVWTLIISLTGYLGLLDFGVRGAVTRYVVKFHTLGSHEDASRIASSGLLIFSAAGILAIAVASGLASFVGGRFHIPPEYQHTARIVLVLAGMNIAVSLISGVFGGVIAALQRFDLLNGAEILVTGLRAIAIVGALYSGKGLITLACIHLTFSVLRGVVNMVIGHKLYPELRFGLLRADIGHARLIFSFSIYMFLIQVGGDLIYYTDSVVIGAFLPVILITFFTIGGNLVEYTRNLLAGISYTISPLASQLEAEAEVEGLRKALLVGCRLATAVTLPILVTFLIRGGTFIGLWMGPQFAALSGHILKILSLQMFFAAGIHPAGSIMLGISRHKPLVLVRVGEGLCNILLSILWVRTIGISGVAWGTTIPGVAFCVLFWPWYVHRTLNVSPFAFVYSCWLRPWVWILPFAVVTYLIERNWPATHMLLFFTQVAVALPTALAGIWFGCVEQEHREKYARGLTHSMVQVFLRS